MHQNVLACSIAAFLVWNSAACAESFWLSPLHKTDSIGNNPSQYEQGTLLAITQTQAEAEEIAQQYDITLECWEDGMAQFSTERDVDEVIRQGRENGWPELSRNDFADLK